MICPHRANGRDNQMSTPQPTATYPDGSATWQVGPFAVSAYPGRPNSPAVALDGRLINAQTALALAEALHAAAVHAVRR